MRSAVIAITMLAAAACGPEFSVVPRGGVERTVASGAGITMTAFAAQWDAYPSDLADYITPIAVDLYNAGPYEVRVSYSDFALTDGHGFRYAAINPFIPAAAIGEVAPATPRPELAADDLVDAPLLPVKPVLVAARGGGVRIGPPGGSRGVTRAAGGTVIGPPAGVRPGSRIGPSYTGRPGYGIRPGYGYGGWHGYHVYGGLRGYYGAGPFYWGGPWWTPPYYGAWVYGWGPDYYPAPRPSADILQLAIPEGVLSPGGHVSGYLYFQNATHRGQQALTLTWSMHEARKGASLGTERVSLQVVKR